MFRLSILPAAGMLLAGCGLSAAPSPTPTLAPTAAATLPAVATPVPTTDPCAGDPASVESGLSVPGVDGVVLIDLEPDAPGPSAPIDPSVEIAGTVLGGPTSVRLFVERPGVAEEPRLVDVVADFMPTGATEPEPVSATIDGSRAFLDLPSSDVSGVLRVAASWSTTCGPASGGGSIGLQLLDPAIAEGCPTTSDRLQAQVDDLQATSLRIGTLDVPIGIVGWSGRWTDAGAIDDFPQFSGWDTAIVIGAAGETLPARDVLGDGIDYTRLRFAFFDRADVMAFLEGSLDEVPVVEVVNRNPTGSGRMNIPMEFPPGAYVVEVQGTWQTPCLNVDSYAVVSLDRG